MNQLFNILRDTGDYAYATARCRAMINKMQQVPRETREIFESNIDRELEEFEKKLVRISPASLRDDLEFFFRSRREIEQLKTEFRKYNFDKKRREGLKIIKLSKWGNLVQEKMSNREVELALDKQWFHAMRSTAFREFIIDLEQLYMKWYRIRSEGKKFEFDPMPVINHQLASGPFGWAVILKCYYTKLKQIQNRRKMAWEGF